MSGSLALLAGPAAMLAPKRRGWHTGLGTSYVILVTLLCLAAIGIRYEEAVLAWMSDLPGILDGADLLDGADPDGPATAS